MALVELVVRRGSFFLSSSGGEADFIWLALVVVEAAGAGRGYRCQPLRRSHRQTNGCHHGRDGRNAGGQPHARQNCTGNDTRWK